MALGPVGVVVLLLQQNKALGRVGVWLARRRDESKPYFGFHAAPGGSMEEGETPLQTAIREVKEETGLEPAPWNFIYGSRTEHTYDNGTPFSMHWFYLALPDYVVPKNTEPHKQGEWKLWGISTDMKPIVTPGTWEALQRWEGTVMRNPTQPLLDRIQQLMEACDTFEKGSAENAETFDVLMKHGLIPVAGGAEVRIPAIVEHLIGERDGLRSWLKSAEAERDDLKKNRAECPHCCR